MARILVSGIATRDIVNCVDHYPAEDEKMRVTKQETRLGGNAANTAVVLAQMGLAIDFLGTINEVETGDALIQQMNTAGIGTTHCPRVPGSTPTSYITLNQQNGSRTIVHHRDLPEISVDDFPFDKLSDYDWIHFEGRNVPTTREILIALRSGKNNITVSLEIEQTRDDIEALIEYADIIFFSSAYARSQGYDKPEDFLQSVQTSCSKLKICSWGKVGAVALDQNGKLFSEPAWNPPVVVDTVAAGDTFNAGIIYALLTGTGVQQALAFACELAGRKVGQQGLNHLSDYLPG